MSTSLQRKIGTSSLLLIAFAFIVAIIVSNQIFSGWRIDLTENRLYTLSDGTKHILKNIENPINLYFYYSDKASENIPSIRSYAHRVRETLNEFERTAECKI